MGSPLLMALLLLGTAAYAAEEPSGCDKFKWGIERERAALTAPDRIKLASGGELAALPSTGVTLALPPPAEAKLPRRRSPRQGRARLPALPVSRTPPRQASTRSVYRRGGGGGRGRGGGL